MHVCGYWAGPSHSRVFKMYLLFSLWSSLCYSLLAASCRSRRDSWSVPGHEGGAAAVHPVQLRLRRLVAWVSDSLHSESGGLQNVQRGGRFLREHPMMTISVCSFVHPSPVGPCTSSQLCCCRRVLHSFAHLSSFFVLVLPVSKWMNLFSVLSWSPSIYFFTFHFVIIQIPPSGYCVAHRSFCSDLFRQVFYWDVERHFSSCFPSAWPECPWIRDFLLLFCSFWSFRDSFFLVGIVFLDRLLLSNFEICLHIWSVCLPPSFFFISSFLSFFVLSSVLTCSAVS